VRLNYLLRGLLPFSEGPAPSFFSLPATKAKHAAWISAGRKYGQDTDQARRRYIEIAQGLGWTFDGDSGAAGSSKRSAGIGGGSVSVMQKVEADGDDDRERCAVVGIPACEHSN
jgi:hypothetical protein